MARSGSSPGGQPGRQPDANTANLSRRFGAAVRRLRGGAGYSQEGFADAVGLHRTAMSSLERGLNDPKLSTMARIAAGLGMTASALVAEVEAEGA